MHLITFLTGRGEEHIGVRRGDQVIDLSVWLGFTARLSLPGLQERPLLDMVDFIRLEDSGLRAARQAVAAPDNELLSAGALIEAAAATRLTLYAPIPRPRKNIVCLGRNYPEHAAESIRAAGETQQSAPPKYPAVFTKAPTTVRGPYSTIAFDPAVSERMDWEAELAVIIGKAGRNITRDRALEHVFGYCVLNDITARDIQSRHGNQFFRGKTLDGSCPLGPWIVTADELPDPSNLEVICRVNGVEKQRGNTREMTFGVPEIIALLSEGTTLEPGDIIATGTPAGVGNARVPPEYLRSGDVVECEVEKVGIIRNRIEGEGVEH